MPETASPPSAPTESTDAAPTGESVGSPLATTDNTPDTPATLAMTEAPPKPIEVKPAAKAPKPEAPPKAPKPSKAPPASPAEAAPTEAPPAQTPTPSHTTVAFTDSSGAARHAKVNSIGRVPLVALSEIDGVQPGERFGLLPAHALTEVTNGRAVLVNEDTFEEGVIASVREDGGVSEAEGSTDTAA